MSFGWIGIAAKAIGGFIAGDGGSKVMEFADKAISTRQERIETDQEEMKGVRAMQFEGLLGKLIDLYQCAQSPAARLIILLMIFVDVLIELSARIIRPGMSIYLFLAFFGFVEVDLPKLTPFQESLTFLVFSFWFGGRALMKDLPTMIKMYRTIK